MDVADAVPLANPHSVLASKDERSVRSKDMQ